MPHFKDTHIRSFHSTVHLVEDKLQEMENALCGIEALQDKNVLLLTVNDVTVQERDLIYEQIKQMRQLLEKFASAYNLHRQEHSLKKILAVKGAFLWEELSGATFDRLQGYGKVDESERASYEDLVNPMTAIAEKLMLLKTITNEN